MTRHTVQHVVSNILPRSVLAVLLDEKIAADAPTFVPSSFRCGKTGVIAWLWCTALPALAPAPNPRGASTDRE